MIIVENTKENRAVQQAVASLAIEGMYVSKDFVNTMLQVARGEKTEEEVIEEIKQKYTR